MARWVVTGTGLSDLLLEALARKVCVALQAIYANDGQQYVMLHFCGLFGGEQVSKWRFGSKERNSSLHHSRAAAG